MFEFLKLKIYREENSLIIKKGFGKVKPAKLMTGEEFQMKLKECTRAGVSAYIAASTVWNLPDGVTELKTNIKNLRAIRNAYQPALTLWYLAKYDGGTYHEILDKLREIGCVNATQED
ncbi:MAG: hypothetical protein E7073_06725 [Bacteroidales bacterium]|nr:hypothetical protein [Bacteroidales bacterium]